MLLKLGTFKICFYFERHSRQLICSAWFNIHGACFHIVVSVVQFVVIQVFLNYC